LASGELETTTKEEIIAEKAREQKREEFPQGAHRETTAKQKKGLGN